VLLLREVIGSNLRAHREHQKRSLRDVSANARVSLGYLSEIERGRKEASSELLACICDALDLELADLLTDASTDLRHRAFVAAGGAELSENDAVSATELKLIFGHDERETVGV
jgi:transcriptional regulator with XRE-family HTH domain